MKKANFFKHVLILALINTTNAEEIDTTDDSIIIVNFLEGLPGGKTLGTDTLPTDQDVIHAGHLVIKETATGLLKALGVTNDAYVALPGGHEYFGVVRASVLKSKPFAAVMVRGTVNEEAFKNKTGLTTPPAAKEVLTLIRFTKD